MNKDHTYYIKNRIKILQKAKEVREQNRQLMEKKNIEQKQYILKLLHLECNKRYKECNRRINEIQINYDVSFE